ncbi:MAG: NepR family anti-sigma factor [Phenylobacterium sp.]|nr:NepR family anti-sigma factor [Phenylobacterium sp.]MDP3852813.1 NepR family anti-sigma factor [Phenylobacterium sp.]
MSGDEDASRGRVLRKPGADNMIEQRPTEERRKASAALDEARLRQQAIGVRLRQMFDEVVSEPVPDEFLEILRKADKTAAEKG